MKNMLLILFLLTLMTACAPPQASMADVQNTAIAIVQTSIALTQTAWPTATPPPATLTPTATIVYPTPSPLPTTPTLIPVTSPYEVDHEEIRKVVSEYFDRLYYMHNSFQVEGLDDLISSASDGKSFLKTELRKQAVDITWERTRFLRYASYNYTLNYIEIVVFDAGQSARVNLSEGNAIVFELSIPHGIVSQIADIKHIIMLRKEQGKWKIIYDVHDDQSHQSLYAPTPFPNKVLSELDKTLIKLSEGQGGAVLPGEGKSFIPSDPTQLKNWKEYETALAEKLMPQYPRDTVLCEWELTGKSEQKLVVWAICMTSTTSANVGNYFFPTASMPAVINLHVDGTVLSVDIPGYGDQYLSDFWRLFPGGAWTDLPSVEAMEKHLHWRRRYGTEPPLVVLNATAIPTVTPTP